MSNGRKERKSKGEIKKNKEKRKKKNESGKNRAVWADKEEKKKEKMGGEEKEETGHREREKKEKGGFFGFSLRSTEIGPSFCEGARSKVHLRGESFAWVRESRSFF